jgi:integrase
MDRKYLEWHGKQYRVQVKVPRKARTILGKARLVVPLKTDSLALANRLKYRVVADLKDKIAKAEAEALLKDRQGEDPLFEEAVRWREAIEAEEADIDAEFDATNAPEELIVTTIVPDLLFERTQEIERRDGPSRASLFLKVAQNAATPLLRLVDAWMAERLNMKPRQKLDYRRAVSKFATWLSLVGAEASVEGATRKLAGRYVSEEMVAKGRHWTTTNKDISAMSGYWKWLVKKGYAAENIWAGQSLPKIKPRTDSDKPKRPFTDEEVLALLSGIDDGMLGDAIVFGALSGMRVEEIARLRAGDCRDGVMRVKAAKTAAGIRDIPVHPDLAPLLLKRIAGKSETEFLFHELTEPRPGSAMERGQPITKRFVVARRRLGVDERIPGHRQSRIDFHSFRRWFIKKARDAIYNGATGFDQWTIADVVGHDRESLPDGLAMTMGRYPGASPLSSRRACVEAVQLPRRADQARREDRGGVLPRPGSKAHF